MPIVVWDGSLNIGIEAIDKQHAYLFEVMNNLFHKTIKGRKKQAVSDVIDSMKNYVRYHFELEERLMAKADYPELAKHKQAHARFIDELDKYEFLQDADVETLPIEILSYLINWCLWHYLTVDKRFVQHLKDTLDPEDLKGMPIPTE